MKKIRLSEQIIHGIASDITRAIIIPCPENNYIPFEPIIVAERTAIDSKGERIYSVSDEGTSSTQWIGASSMEEGWARIWLVFSDILKSTTDALDEQTLIDLQYDRNTIQIPELLEISMTPNVRGNQYEAGHVYTFGYFLTFMNEQDAINYSLNAKPNVHTL